MEAQLVAVAMAVAVAVAVVAEAMVTERRREEFHQS